MENKVTSVGTTHTLNFPLGKYHDIITQACKARGLEIISDKFDGAVTQILYTIVDYTIGGCTGGVATEDIVEPLALSISNGYSDVEDETEGLLYENVYALHAEIQAAYVACLDIIRNNEEEGIFKHIEYLSDVCYDCSPDIVISALITITESKLIVYGDYTNQLMCMSRLLSTSGGIEFSTAWDISTDLATMAIYKFDTTRVNELNYTFYDEILKEYSMSSDGAVQNGRGPTYNLINGIDLDYSNLIESILIDISVKAGYAKAVNKKMIDTDGANKFRVILECLEYKEVE